jgi:hypothetical protein
MKLNDWTERGYRRYEVAHNNREMNKLADFILQKRIDDKRGKKYFITVYCYDRTKYPDPHREFFKDRPIGYMPTVQMVLGDDKPHFNIEMNGDFFFVDEVEAYFEKFWNLLERPYYEEFEHEAN